MCGSPISRLKKCLFLNIIQFLAFIALVSLEISAEHCHLDSPSIDIGGENRSLGETYPKQTKHSALHSPNLNDDNFFMLDSGTQFILGTVSEGSENPQSLITAVSNKAKKPKELADVVLAGGYRLKKHQVNTTDDWSLTIFQLSNSLDETRINKSLAPVLIGHGLVSSGADWLVQKRKTGLPYLLADQGFDVWLGNSRGNILTDHNGLDKSSYDYWDFSVHEMGKYDVPAVIEYIVENTRSDIKKINYVGYSMSTTSFFICMSENSTYNDYINKMVAVAPAVFLIDMNTFASVIGELGIIEDAIVKIKLLGGRLFTPEIETLLHFLGKTFCHSNPLTPGVGGLLCETLLDILNGKQSNNVKYDADTAEIVESFFPSPTSAKTVAHYLQFIRSGKFRPYKDILDDNDNPPEYNLKATTCEVLIIRGSQDTLISAEGAEKLKNCLENAKIKNNNITVAEGFNHVSFVYANAAENVYKQIWDYFK